MYYLSIRVTYVLFIYYHTYDFLNILLPLLLPPYLYDLLNT